MTIRKFLLFGFLQWLILTAVKLWFFNHQIFSNSGWQEIAYWVLTAAVVAALSRRFGVLNYLEAFFLATVWSLGDALMDLLITSIYTGLGIFYTRAYWFGFLFLALGIILFHKKRHIHVRHELHAKHHGHH
ncbi:MAG: hypothetical protein HY918_01635 [Candidatus Doudnabacteria bacterium]|nr:hypothetical protein [Candidatus Doudnabacteria bacterium]